MRSNKLSNHIISLHLSKRTFGGAHCKFNNLELSYMSCFHLKFFGQTAFTGLKQIIHKKSQVCSNINLMVTLNDRE